MRDNIYSSVIDRTDLPFRVFIGGRGIGKTYSALKYYSMRDTDKKFILLRRTDTEVQTIVTNRANPFKSISIKENVDIDILSEDNGYNIHRKNDDGTSNVIGYVCAVSTITKMRGMDYSDVDTIIFDEFIPENHVRVMRSEGEAFFNAYETINRNREFYGDSPVTVYFLANAISLNSPILLSLGLVSIIANMKVKGKSKYSDRKRGIYVELMENVEFKKLKAETALYKLTAGTDFSENALNNNFNYDDQSMIGKVNINEYKPEFSYGSYVVYVHKQNGDLYIKHDKNDSVKNGNIFMEGRDSDIVYWRFAPRYRLAKLQRRIKFDDYATKLVFDALIKK